MIPYNTYLLAAMLCIPAMVQAWLAGLRCVLEIRNTSEQEEIGVYIMIK